MKNNYSLIACFISFCFNFILFLVKLFIGLRTNSISVFSDAINNCLDCFSGIVIFASLYFVNRHHYKSNELKRSNKTENLLSFLMSLTIFVTGLYFAYTSVERMMYPAPVWFTWFYAYILLGTAVLKICMFFIFNHIYKKESSDIIKIIRTDCILDCFITLITVLTLVISEYGTYSFDSYLGIIISIIVTISAVKLMLSNAKILINYIENDKIEYLEKIMKEQNLTVDNISVVNDGKKNIAYIKAIEYNKKDMEIVKQKCMDEISLVVEFLS